MVKRFPTLGALVSTKTKCIKLIFIGKITLVPVAFLMDLSIHDPQCVDGKFLSELTYKVNQALSQQFHHQKQ